MGTPVDGSTKLPGMIDGVPRRRPDRHQAPFPRPLGTAHHTPTMPAACRLHDPTGVLCICRRLLDVLFRMTPPRHVDNLQHCVGYCQRNHRPAPPWGLIRRVCSACPAWIDGRVAHRSLSRDAGAPVPARVTRSGARKSVARVALAEVRRARTIWSDSGASIAKTNTAPVQRAAAR